MALEKVEVSPSRASFATPSKRRRLSSHSQGRIVSASHRLLLCEHRLRLQDLNECIAFSPTEPLVAMPHTLRSSVKGRDAGVAPIPPSLSIAIKPLLSASGDVSPLVLCAPLLLDAEAAFRVRTLKFSPTGRSLAAVIWPEQQSDKIRSLCSSTPNRHGLVCIWTRSSNGSGPMNEGWYLSGSWPMAVKGGQFDSNIIALYWLPTRLRQVALYSYDLEHSARVSAAPSNAQLPGMTQEVRETQRPQRRFHIKPAPCSGPVLQQRGNKEPEALLLVGANNTLHFLHRNVSLQDQSPPMKALQAPFHVLSAPLSSPGAAVRNYGQLYGSQGDCGQETLVTCDIYPVLDEGVLLLASVKAHNNSHVALTEVIIQIADDEPSVAVKPLHPIFCNFSSQRECPQNSSAFSQISCAQFCSMFSDQCDDSTESKSEDIRLIVAMERHLGMSKLSTSLATWSIRRRTGAMGRASLCESFATLDSRKATLEEMQVDEDFDWWAELQETRTYPNEALIELSSRARHAVAGHCSHLLSRWLVAADLREDTACKQVWRLLFPNDLQRNGPEDRRLASPIFARHIISTNAALEAVLQQDSGRMIIHPTMQLLEVSSSKDHAISLALRLADCILNERTYVDVLFAAAPLLRQRAYRLRVLANVATGLGSHLSELSRLSTETQSEASSGSNLLRQLDLRLLEQLLYIHITVLRVTLISLKHAAPVWQGSLASEQDVQWECRQELNKSRTLLRLLGTLKTLCSARCQVTVEGKKQWTWDTQSIHSLRPTVVALVQDLETLVREAILRQSMASLSASTQSGASRSDANIPSSDAEYPSPMLLLLSTQKSAPLALELLIHILRLTLDLTEWLDAVVDDEKIMGSLCASEAESLVRDVSIIKAIRTTYSIEDQAFSRNDRPLGGPTATSQSGATPQADSTPAMLNGLTNTLGLASTPQQTQPQHLGHPASSTNAASGQPFSSQTAYGMLQGNFSGSSLQLSRYSRSLSRSMAYLQSSMKEIVAHGCALDLFVLLAKLDRWRKEISKTEKAKFNSTMSEDSTANTSWAEGAGPKEHERDCIKMAEDCQVLGSLLGIQVALDTSPKESGDVTVQKVTDPIDEQVRRFCDCLLAEQNKSQSSLGHDLQSETQMKPRSDAAAKHRSILKHDGLPLFVSSNDFVTTLADVTPPGNPRASWLARGRTDRPRDALTGCELPDSAASSMTTLPPRTRRNLLTGDATTAEHVPEEISAFAVEALASGVYATAPNGATLLGGNEGVGSVNSSGESDLKTKIQAEEEALAIALAARAQGLGDRVKVQWSRQLYASRRISSGPPNYWWAE